MEQMSEGNSRMIQPGRRTCTRCRGDPGEEASGAILDDSRTAQGNTAPRYGQVEKKDVNND